LLQRS